MKRKMLLGLLVLVSLSLLSASAATAASPLWTFPLDQAASMRMSIAPSGVILDEECTEIQPDGSELWTLPMHPPALQQCYEAISDSAGNLYVFRGNNLGEGVVESFDSLGQFRWSTTTGTYGPTPARPVLGANGDVYFSSLNGFTGKLIGLNKATGAITVETGIYDPAGVSAYNGGIVVAEEPDVVYLGYDGSAQHDYEISEISRNEAWSDATGANGTVFAGGYSGSCGTDAHASVEKFTPGGLAWTWTASGVAECSQTGVAVTPDGGVILGRDEGLSATYTSIGPNGNERWTNELTGAEAASRAGYLPISVDVNGTVGLPADIDYVCASPSGYCEEAVVKYLSAITGATVLPEVVLGSQSPEGGFSIYGDAAFTDRTYLTGYFYEIDGQSEGEPVIVAFNTPGLGQPYSLFLQEEVTKANPPVPPPPGQPTLPVTVADGGGGGVAGAPDPGSVNPDRASVNPCGSVHGGFVRRLLAAARCEWARNKAKAQCAVGVSGWLFLPLKVLKGAKLASGLLDTSKIAKPLQPVAKLYNDLSLAKYTAHAPPGFKNFGQTKDTLETVEHARKLVKLLPELREALSAHDFSEVAWDISKIGGFDSCVQVLSDAMS